MFPISVTQLSLKNIPFLFTFGYWRNHFHAGLVPGIHYSDPDSALPKTESCCLSLLHTAPSRTLLSITLRGMMGDEVTVT